jgi:hypothetical protein
VLKVTPDKLADLLGVESEAALDRILRRVIAATSSREDFISGVLRHRLEVDRKIINMFGRSVQDGLETQDMESILSDIRRIISEEEALVDTKAGEGIPVAYQTTNDPTTLGREISGLEAKVNILLGAAGGLLTLLIGLIAGAIALWQEIGGVETRLTRELGQAETRITQQIADVRSEVGEIRGRLSAMGQAGPTPPR